MANQTDISITSKYPSSFNISSSILLTQASEVVYDASDYADDTD
tara:strand:+ start:4598 stop:4729 length:132 start_codon:yes stop_codon:yes gene_type:complete